MELKTFQTNAALDIISELADARDSVAKGKVQAIILSAPTGSGKTITLAQVIDLTFGGGDGISARPDTVFLWLSDSPELNIQSQNKLLNACDELPYYKMVIGDALDDDTQVARGGVAPSVEHLVQRLFAQAGLPSQFLERDFGVNQIA
jgi:type III restriction enzyme